MQVFTSKIFFSLHFSELEHKPSELLDPGSHVCDDVRFHFSGMFDGSGAKTWAIGKSHLSDDGLEITAQVEAQTFWTLDTILTTPSATISPTSY